MMRRLLATLALLAATLGASPALAQETQEICPTGYTCVPKEDMETVIQLLRDQKCRAETPPKYDLDGITIVEDQDGRIYGSGAAPKPYTLKMSWCNYEVTASGKVQLLVAKHEPPTWGLRFRPKFSSGFLFTKAVVDKDALSAVDVGVLFEGFYYRAVNLNVALGFRSVGAGVGLDLTKNFGVYAGYAVSYEGWLSNPYAGLSFAFW